MSSEAVRGLRNLIGSTISHYRIVEKLGTGGMGVVYKAEDLRLNRFVALKLLSPQAMTSRGRERFLHEAKAASVLDHPNICTVYELDEAEDDRLFIAMAFCEGETLREKIQRGPLKLEEVVDFGSQIAAGLGAAHAKGIVHRDVKPANLLVTPEGRVKIVDFGVAKLASQTRLTKAGNLVGTLAYMSPEQLGGMAVDQRTDIWSLGMVIHEMVTGRLPFLDEYEPALVQSILQREPEPLTALRTGVPMALERVVAKAMAKDPADRYQHVDEVPVDLRALCRVISRSQPANDSTWIELPRISASLPRSALSRSWLRKALLLVSLSLVALSAGWLAGWAWHGPEHREPPSFRLLTFRRGTLRSARFASDGQTVVYGAAWEGGPIRVYLTRLDSLQSTELDIPSAELLSLSPSGELAVSLGHRVESALQGEGTLARVPLLGGSPREVLEHVREADWAPDGSGLAVVRRAGGQERLELPGGRILYSTHGYISQARFSPSGKAIAFLDHTLYEDDRGAVAVVDLGGRKTELSTGWSAVRGLAWSPSGSEVWFSARRAGEGLSVYGVDLRGRVRSLLRTPGSVVLLDVSHDGRVLLAREDDTRHIMALPSGESHERDLSWLDRSSARDISRDGRFVLLTHFGEGSGPNYSVILRATNGSSGVRLGEGEAMALSPDGHWAASLLKGPPSRVLLLPTGAGETRTLVAGIEVSAVAWFPDGNRLLLVGQEPRRGVRCYVKPLANGTLRPVTPEGVGESPWGVQLSPDGSLLAAASPEGRVTLYPTAGGAPRLIAGLANQERLLRWTPDGSGLLVASYAEIPVRIYRIDVATGVRALWKEIAPADPAGLIPKITIYLTPDGRSYAYNSQRILSSLYLVDGLR